MTQSRHNFYIQKNQKQSKKHYGPINVKQNMLLNPIAPLKSSSIRNLAVHSHSTRRFNDLRLPRPCTNWGIQTFIDHAAWNSLPIGFKDINFLSMFPEAKTRKTKHLKLFCYTSQLKNRLRRNRLLYAGWLTYLPRFQLRSTT